MSASRASFKQSDAARALRAAVAAGLHPSGYTIGADGSITVNLEESRKGNDNTFDELMRQPK